MPPINSELNACLQNSNPQHNQIVSSQPGSDGCMLVEKSVAVLRHKICLYHMQSQRGPEDNGTGRPFPIHPFPLPSPPSCLLHAHRHLEDASGWGTWMS